MNIINWSCRPTATSGVYLTEFDAEATNDVWKHLVWVLEGTGSGDFGFYGCFEVPQNYNGTPKLTIVWTANATTNSAYFQFKYRAVSGNDSESLDQSGNDESVVQLDGAPSAVFERLSVSKTLTDNFAAGDTVQYEFWRDPSDALDTMSENALIFALLFEYDDGT